MVRRKGHPRIPTMAGGNSLRSSHRPVAGPDGPVCVPRPSTERNIPFRPQARGGRAFRILYSTRRDPAFLPLQPVFAALGCLAVCGVHPGYLLPVVAGSFVASIGFASLHVHDAAMAAFGVGVFFWLVVGTVVTVRLMTGGALAPAAKTGLSAYLAAPATANIAWIVSHPGPVGTVQLGLTGVLAIMALLQVMLLPEYSRLPFSPAFWVFTFPVGATTTYAIRWLATTNLPGWEIYSWTTLGLATAFTVAIAARTATTGRARA